MKAILLFLALAVPCFARIGETKEQCIARYGKVERAYDKNLVFLKGGLKINIEYYQGKACWIAFEKQEGKLSDDEIKVLLNANGPKVKWEKVKHGSDMVYLDTENVLMGHFDTLKQVLFIRTVESVARDTSEAAKDAKENLKDF